MGKLEDGKCSNEHKRIWKANDNENMFIVLKRGLIQRRVLIKWRVWESLLH